MSDRRLSKPRLPKLSAPPLPKLLAPPLPGARATVRHPTTPTRRELAARLAALEARVAALEAKGAGEGKG